MTAEIREFRVEFSSADLEDLAQRLAAARWPSPETVSDWSQGTPLASVQALAAYWADGYDCRAFEARLNAVPQFRTEIDGVDVHFLHARSPHDGAVPLLLTHGWPGSVREFLDLVEPLTNPADPADAFHVVVPSLPGFGFTSAPSEPGWTVERISDAWAALMERLGYQRYGAHGGDWGAVITSRLAATHPDHVVGIHVTIPIVDLDPSPEPEGSLSAFEQAGADRSAQFFASGMAYAHLQMTAPQTLGVGLADSPVGQLAWILDKFYNWTDCHGDPENAIDRDTMLDNVTLYWLTNTAASSARLYWESLPRMPEDVVAVPVGCSIFAMEHVRVPRKRTDGRILDLRYWNELPSGGHFPGLECPDVLAEELRAFFALIRS